MLPLDLRIIGLEGDRVGVYELFDECFCCIMDLAIQWGNGMAFVVVVVFIGAMASARGTDERS